MLFLLISFVSGVLTVLAPCILPLLPVIIGGTVSGGSNKRAFTIISSLVISVVSFTLLIKVSSIFLHIPQDFWKYFSGIILFILGSIMVFPRVWENISLVRLLNIHSNKVLGKSFMKNTFIGDVLTGTSLGPVFSTCSPTYFVILATVLPSSFILGLIYLFAYALGLGLVLFIISLVGQKFADRLGVFSDPNGWFKKCIGIIFIFVSLAIITGFDKKLETKILNGGYFDITKVETKILQKANSNEMLSTQKKEQVASTNTSTEQSSYKSLGNYTEIVGASGYINTDGKPIKISDYIGKKIIVVDFMTYSCINCQRTFPYLNDWYAKYKDSGLIVIGIHTPEFAFEKDIKNVDRELHNLGIQFPVVLDNDYKTWNAYKNQFWPRKYIIDLNGNVVYDHIGEGEYTETEKVLQDLLKTIPGNSLQNTTTTKIDSPDLQKISSPETYLGYDRSEGNLNSNYNDCINATCTFKQLPTSLNAWSLGGVWKVGPENITGTTGSTLRYTFSASKFHLVAGALNDKDVQISVRIDGGKPKIYSIKSQTLYTLSDFGNVYGTHSIDIEILSGSLEAYSITFS